MKCSHACVAQTSYLFGTKLQIEPDYPCLADKIAGPRPDMNIKVAASADPEGGDRGSGPPLLENHKLYGFL